VANSIQTLLGEVGGEATQLSDPADDWQPPLSFAHYTATVQPKLLFSDESGFDTGVFTP